MIFADPDLGPVSLRDVPRAERASILAEIDALDLARAASVVEVVEAGDEETDLSGTDTAVRSALFAHALVRAGVMDPEPPSLDATTVDAYPPLSVLIQTDDAWTPAAVRRIYEALMAEEG